MRTQVAGTDDPVTFHQNPIKHHLEAPSFLGRHTVHLFPAF